MPSRTLEDKVDDLTKLVATLTQQVRTLEAQLDGITTERADLAREVGANGRSLAVLEQQLKELRGWKDGFGSVDQLKVEQALARHDLEELKKWQEEIKKQTDEWSRRIWTLISGIIIALVSLAVGYYLRSPR